MRKVFKAVQEIKDVLKSEIFTTESCGTAIFEDNMYAHIPVEFGTLCTKEH